MKYKGSLVVVEDITRSRLLYETILKQKVIADYGEDITFEGGFVLHKKDHYRKLIDEKAITAQSNSFELYFEDDDLEIIEKVLIKNKFEFVHELREQPWRQKVLRFYDYDKNIVEIGESLEHVAYRLFLENKSYEEIKKITYLPIEKIKESITRFIEERKS